MGKLYEYMNKTLIDKSKIHCYTPNNKYDIKDLHNIFEVNFNTDNDTINKCIMENIISVSFIKNILVINFISYDYINENNEHLLISDDDLENAFKENKNIIKIADRSGNIINTKEFINCQLIGINDNYYAYDITIYQNKIKSMFFKFTKLKNYES